MTRNLYAILIAATLSLPTLANHYSGGNITWTCLGEHQYDVTLQLFVDCSGASVVPQDLHFASSCGTSFDVSQIPVPEGVEVSQLCPQQIGNSTCNGGTLPGMRLYEFHTQIALDPCDSWTIGWNICCRATSLNLTGNQGEYIEAVLNSATAVCDASPVFAEAALPYVCVDQPVNYNFGVSDPDGDSLAYSFIDARRFTNVVEPVIYRPGFSGAEPVPGITLDAATGQVNFTPALIGYYIVAVQVNAYNDANALTGSVMRDIIFVVIDCTNNNPDANSGTITNLTGPVTQTDDYSVTVCGGSSFCFDAVISDPDDLQTLALESNVATVLPGAVFSVSGENPATATVCWSADGVAPGTYIFTINATDDACPQPASQILSYAITISSAPNAGENTAASICSTDPPPNLFDLLGGGPDADGTFTEVSPGVYHYVVTAIGDCPADSSVLTVTTVQASDAGIENAITVCENGDAVLMIDSLLGTPQPGGGWTSPDAQAHSGFFDPATDPLGVYCYTVPGTVPCANAVACLSITALLPANDPACLGTSIAPISVNEDVHLFPDPSRGSLSISVPANAQRVEVIDAQGRLVAVFPMHNVHGRVEIALPSSLPNGGYSLRVIDEGSMRTTFFQLLR